jgi:cyclic pyranopterin phosphate synthase
VTCKPETLAQVRAGSAPKGSVLQTAELAGIMAAKRTAELIPLCHPLPLTKVAVRIELDEELPGFRATSEVRTKAETGVEMEALTAVSVACLTLFDMLKAIDRTMVIGGIEVVSKIGGKSGDWRAE